MKPTSAPAGSALARLFESRREIRKLERENAELGKEKTALEDDILRHKQLLEFYSAGVQQRDDLIMRAILRVGTFTNGHESGTATSAHEALSLLHSVLLILQENWEAKNPPENPNLKKGNDND